MNINIAIVDDHNVVREGIKQLLEIDGEIKVIGEARDGIECLEMLKHTIPDVLLLDINMPNMNGLQVLEKIKANLIKVKILILTIHNEVEYLIKAVNIGVNGYVLKDSDSADLKKAICAVYNGETYIQPNLTPLLKESLRKKAEIKARESDLLTKRELQVLELLSEGLLNKEIAYKLDISEKTVKNHISNIFKKINVSDRTQAAVYAIKNNIVDIL
ncbi:LuxR family two component transcriptional regulator [Mobilisporobacter senegalensis]|uniref:Stage 0 sporulation protein A homolog n=1 Tax=Mobilisporobacter senegalensis TaxID=1329262 RepID=A0A3N1X5S9_9FIRM|nr:response regulator transcription factor [Mobilisporobacter senegalensis]ROR22140.1 LuxR family two component transcriptional regulator [Mobilisporobacter senegalensis]